MELFKTTPEIAIRIIKEGNRTIKLGNGYTVKAIHLNEQTLFATKGMTGKIYDLKEVDLFIYVPTNAKTVY